MSKETPYRAKKSLGQNFLQDQNICRRIVQAIEIDSRDILLEIGPGQGALTKLLVEEGPAQLMTLEKDDELASDLVEKFPSIEMMQGDALEFDWHSLNAFEECKIVGNLPYNIGSKLIWDIVSQVKTMERAIFMVQHEVAMRLTAEPGNKTYGGLTAWVNNFAETKYLFKVPPTVFRPRPKVDSAVVAFRPLSIEDWPEKPELLARLIKMLFQQRRKQISSILKKKWSESVELWFETEQVDPKARPENLSPAQFKRLSNVISL